MKEENKIAIDLGYDNLQLIVERNLDPGYNEVFVGLERNGVWVQDLAIVGQQHHYDDDCNVIGETGCEFWSMRMPKTKIIHMSLRLMCIMIRKKPSQKRRFA